MKAFAVATLLALTLLFLSPDAGAERRPFDPGRAGFSVRLNEIASDYRVFAVFLLPGEDLAMRPSRPVRVTSPKGQVRAIRDGWSWTAPARPGVYPLQLSAGSARMTVNAVVMRPASEMRGGAMDHYMIGTYVVRAGGAGDVNEAPRGFIQVTREMLDLPVSPHFRLGQFLCKQESAWPKYMVLREPLVLKLEAVLQKVNAAGIRADGFTVMSGFRTPHYNAAIGNRTTSSRHLYGGAADVFIDEDRDGRMDDLNRDGHHDRRDAEVLYRLIDGLSREPAPVFVPGGLSAYAANAAHGPFVHVDARGVRARW